VPSTLSTYRRIHSKRFLHLINNYTIDSGSYLRQKLLKDHYWFRYFSSLIQLLKTTVGNDRQQCAGHLLACRVLLGSASPPCRATPLVAGVLRLGVERPLKYGERARVRARGVLEMSLTGNATRSTAVEMGPRESLVNKLCIIMFCRAVIYCGIRRWSSCA
jgi:hypothetical protein